MKKITIIYKIIIIIIWIGSLIYKVAYTLPSNSPTTDWCSMSNLGLMFYSLLILIISVFFGLISEQEFIGDNFFSNQKVNYFLLYIGVLQFLLSLYPENYIQGLGALGISNFMSNILLLSPTLVYIIRSYFRRILSIDKMLKELTNKKDK